MPRSKTAQLGNKSHSGATTRLGTRTRLGSGTRANNAVASAAAQIMIPRLLFIVSTIAILVFGLVMVYSASFVEAFTDPSISSSSYYFTHQLMLVGVGLVIMVIAMVVDYRIWSGWASWIPWVIVTLLLIFTLAFGNTELGGTRWIDLFGFSFQPSEFAKITMVLVAGTLAIKVHDTGRVRQIALTAGLAIGLPILFILLQPDLGTAIIALAGLIAVAWFGELPMKALGIAILLVVFVGAAMIMLAGFRMSRIDAWLNPWAVASDEGYQIINSFYAFAGGGVFGVGLGMSHQKYLYLPEPQNDLIYPIIGEEFGLMGTVLVVVLFLVFLYAAFRIARNAPDFYGRIIAGAAAAMVGFQAFLNMLCMVGLLPLTGKPLPFFSAGGSSIIVTLICVGLILNVSLRTKLPDPASLKRDKLFIIDGGGQDLLPWGNESPGRPLAPQRPVSPSSSEGPTVVGMKRLFRKPGSAGKVRKETQERQERQELQERQERQGSQAGYKQRAVTPKQRAVATPGLPQQSDAARLGTARNQSSALSSALSPARQAQAAQQAAQTAQRGTAPSQPATRQPAARESAGRQPSARESAGRQPAGRETTTRQPAARETAARQPAARETASRQSAGKSPADSGRSGHSRPLPGAHASPSRSSNGRMAKKPPTASSGHADQDRRRGLSR